MQGQSSVIEFHNVQFDIMTICRRYEYVYVKVECHGKVTMSIVCLVANEDSGLVRKDTGKYDIKVLQN